MTKAGDESQAFAGDRTMQPFSKLREWGLLWLINRVVFHPRGHALAFRIDDETGEPTGWRLLGDGSEVFTFGDEADHEEFARVRDFFQSCSKAAYDRRLKRRRWDAIRKFMADARASAASPAGPGPSFATTSLDARA